MNEKPIYRDNTYSCEERARDLVSKMTLWEKASQTVHQSPAVPRLGIPAYNWWNEALHGIARAGVATVFPQAIGMAATFSDALVYKVADITSTEGRAKYNESFKHGDYDIYKGITYWTPNINIFRDPRWGRGHETYGEDPYLTSKMGLAFVKGLQGDGKVMKSAACAKHFAVHSGPEALRHEFDAVVSEKDLWETYLPAFEVLVREGNVEAVMGAYNRTNGEPCCGSESLLKHILREKWGFSGHVVSDCWALIDFHENHKVTKTALESVALALKNGCDLNCGNMYLNMLLALQEGLIAEEDIDKAVTRLMTTRMKLGMFDHETEFDSIPYEVVGCREHLDCSLETARQSLVLLKNKNNILPFTTGTLKSIAVIGPNADSREALLGNYNGTPPRYVTVLEGIRKESEQYGIRVNYAEGCHLWKDRVQGLGLAADRISEAVTAAEKSDLVILCVGLDASIEGEQGDAGNEFGSGDKPDLFYPKPQLALMEAIKNTKKPVVLVSMTGSAMDLRFCDQYFDGIIQAWYPGGEGGTAIAELIFGKFSPSGRLPVTFYKTVEELPEFCDYAMKGRTYRYMENEALYPFGYGLSYTTFHYLRQSAEVVETDLSEEVPVSIAVKNTGLIGSYEKIQCYIQKVSRSVDAPKWQLKSFQSVFIHTGEEKQMAFRFQPDDFSCINAQGEKTIEEGMYKIYIGGGQPDERTLTLTNCKPVAFEIRYKK